MFRVSGCDGMIPAIRGLVAALACVSAASLDGFQTSDVGYATSLSPSLANVAKSMHATIRRNLVEAAAEMSADEYAFKPTIQVRTFAELVGHLIDANRFFCSEAKGEKPAESNFVNVPDKAVLVNALNDVLSYCDRVYAATTDATYNQPVSVPAMFGEAATNTVRGAVLTFNTAHNNEHYGNMVVYMRLRGHVPPSTARRDQTLKKK